MDKPGFLKGQKAFLDYLESADVSHGPVKALVCKFRMQNDVREALAKVVTAHGCGMEVYDLSEEETKKVDARRKGQLQHTFFIVTPAAQEAYRAAIAKNHHQANIVSGTKPRAKSKHWQKAATVPPARGSKKHDAGAGTTKARSLPTTTMNSMKPIIQDQSDDGGEEGVDSETEDDTAEQRPRESASARWAEQQQQQLVSEGRRPSVKAKKLRPRGTKTKIIANPKSKAKAQSRSRARTVHTAKLRLQSPTFDDPPVPVSIRARSAYKKGKGRRGEYGYESEEEEDASENDDESMETETETDDTSTTSESESESLSSSPSPSDHDSTPTMHTIPTPKLNLCVQKLANVMGRLPTPKKKEQDKCRAEVGEVMAEMLCMRPVKNLKRKRAGDGDGERKGRKRKRVKTDREKAKGKVKGKGKTKGKEKEKAGARSNWIF